jgi:hypothetical protein
MKKRRFFKFVFIGLALIFATFTYFQYSTLNMPMASQEKLVSYKHEKINRLGPKPPPPTREDIRRQQEIERKQEAKEQAEREAAKRKDDLEKLKLWLGFGATFSSSLVSIVLALINRKKST